MQRLGNWTPLNVLHVEERWIHFLIVPWLIGKRRVLFQHSGASLHEKAGIPAPQRPLGMWGRQHPRFSCLPITGRQHGRPALPASLTTPCPCPFLPPVRTCLFSYFFFFLLFSIYSCLESHAHLPLASIWTLLPWIWQPRDRPALFVTKCFKMTPERHLMHFCQPLLETSMASSCINRMPS